MKINFDCEGGALGIGRTKFYDLLARGELNTVALGKTLTLSEELDSFVAELRHRALMCAPAAEVVHATRTKVARHG